MGSRRGVGVCAGGRDPDDGFLVLDCVAAAQKIDNVLDSIFRALISCIQVFQIPVDGGGGRKPPCASRRRYAFQGSREEVVACSGMRPSLHLSLALSLSG